MRDACHPQGTGYTGTGLDCKQAGKVLPGNAAPHLLAFSEFILKTKNICFQTDDGCIVCFQ